MLRDWRAEGDMENQVRFDDMLGRALKAARRWTFHEMGIYVRWRLCFEVAAVVFIAVSVLWLAEAVPQVLAPVH